MAKPAAVAKTNEIVIVPLQDVPEKLGGVRLEPNLLWYGPSEVLLAQRGGEVVGAIRLAVRHDPVRRHGLITDLIVDAACRNQGLEEQLIRAAQRRLKAQGVTKIDALVVDGRGLASSFYRVGFWPSRKTVVLEWDLTQLPSIEASPDFHLEETDRPDPETTADFILASYQPYWRWWKEGKLDRKWYRVEYPASPPRRPEEEVAEVRRRIVAMLREFGTAHRERMFLAYHEDKLVGLCDARVVVNDENFAWGPLVLRAFGGRRLGSTLLKPALEWLRDAGLERARWTTTSGLDDYDPTVYLCVLGSGAQIRGEFLDLVKRRL